MRLTLFFALTFLVYFRVSGQNEINNQTGIENLVKNELALITSSKSFKQELGRRYPNIQGYIILDISLNEKGKVMNLFTSETDLTNIGFLEYLYREILKHSFNFRLATKQTIKIKQTLII